ncbi:MAG: thymidylate synthase [Bacteroidales bacterium]|jgi:thymidylate synthase|nr:thymidylate synthase [Bacteroidales bacterium]
MEITVTTIAEAHERVVKDILLHGEELKTENGELTIEWPPEDPYVIHIKQPFKPPMFSEACKLKIQSLNGYVEQLLTLHPPSSMSATYYYSNRLFDYPLLDCNVNGPCGKEYYYNGNGLGTGINQIITSIVERLAKSPNSRRAIAITWVPDIDIQSDEPPCLQLVQCFIRNNQLHMTVVFRSHDMLSAYGANVYGLAHMQKLICDEINELSINRITIGTLTTISSSAHIYWKRDTQEFNEFKRRMIL